MEEVALKDNKTKGVFSRITSNVKKKIFQVINMTLKYDSMSQFAITVICFLELMQLLSYSFNKMFKETWMIQTYEDIYFYLNQFFELFLLIPYLKDKSYPLFLSVFYIIIIVLLFLAGIFIYLSVALKNNQVLKLWPIHMLKIFGSLFNSVLLLPMLQSIIPFLSCAEMTEIFPNNNLACFSGELLIHFLFAIFALAIIIIFSLIFALFYYDFRPSNNNFVSRLNTKFDFSLLIYKILIAFGFEFLDGLEITARFDLFMAFFLIKASAVLFFILHANQIYYNNYTKKIYSIMTSIFFNTNIILFVSKIAALFDLTEFDGYFQIWCLFVTLICVYEYFYEDEYAKNLLFSIDKIIKPEDALTKINFFIELSDKRETHEASEIILKGFIFQHEDTCEIKDCPLKLYKQKYLNRNENLRDDDYKLLLAYCNRMYEMCIFKFPKDIQLRLSYCAFLFGKLKNLTAVKFQLHMVKKMMPSLTQQLTLYRFKRVIEEEYYHMDDENVNLEIVSTIAFEQFSKTFKECVERVGILYIDFWNAFVQDDMNMVKLKSLGFKINDLISQIFSLWNKMQMLNPNDGESNRIYGQFLTDILNEKALGQQYIEKYKMNQGGYSHLKLFRNDINTLCADGSPVILSKPLENKSAVITQMTSSVTKLFGYSKMELIGKSISVLLPNMFREFHNYSVAKFLKAKHNSKSMESKKISGLALHKTGFLIPIKFNFMLLPNLSSEPTIGIVIQKEKFQYYTGYLLINREMEIINLTPECVKFFNMSDKGIWAIRNHSNIRKEDRINLRNLVQELPKAYNDDSGGRPRFNTNEVHSPSHTKKLMNIMKEYMDKEKIQTVHFIEFDSVYSKKKSKEIDQSSRKGDSLIFNANNSNFGNSINRRRSSITKSHKVNSLNLLNSNKYKGIFQYNSQATGTMFIKEMLFSGKATEYYVVRLESIPVVSPLIKPMINNNSNNPFELKFTENKMIMYDKDNAQYIIDNKDKLEIHRLSKLGNYFKRKSVMTGSSPGVSNQHNQVRSNFQSILKNSLVREGNSKESPNLSINLLIPKTIKEEQNEESRTNTSNISERKKQKRSKKKHAIPEPVEIPQVKDNDKIEDLYRIHGIQNYGVDLEYRWDYVNNVLRLFMGQGETRIIKEIIEITETETMPYEDITTNEEEDEEVEDNSEKNKIEIKKSEIFSKEHISASSSVEKLQWSSVLIILLQFMIAIVSFVLYTSYFDKVDNYIDAVMYLSKQLNYSLTSADLTMNKLIVNMNEYTSSNDKIGTMKYLDKLLKENSKELYDIRTTMSSNPIFIENKENIPSNKVDFHYLIWHDPETGHMGQGKVTLDYFESSREINSAIFTLTEHFNIGLSFWSSDVFYFLHNCLNNYFFKSYYFFTQYNSLFASLNPNSSQMIIILSNLGVFITVMIFISIFFVDSLDKMDDILVEFLSIRPGEAQMIVKRCENFVKNVRINNTDEEEDDKEDEIDAKELKRNNVALIDKLKKMRTGHLIVFIMLLFGLAFLETYYLVDFILVSNHKDNLNEFIVAYNSTQNYIFSYSLLSAAVKTNIFSSDFYVQQNPTHETILTLFEDTNNQKVQLLDIMKTSSFYSNSFISTFNNEIMLSPLNTSALLNFSDTFLAEYPYSNFDTLHSDYYNSLSNFFNLVETDHSALKTILNNHDLFNADFLLYNGLNVYFRTLSTALYEEVKSQNDKIRNFNLIWFSIYQIMVIGFYLFIWRPMENKLIENYTRTKLLILLIPTKMIMKRNKILGILKRENLVSIKK